MSGLRFVLLCQPDQRLDLSALTPDRLAGLDAVTIARTPLQTTRHPNVAGDVFRIVMGDASMVTFEGGSDRFDLVGSGMQHGRIVVEGNAGVQAGRGMASGEIEIQGNTGPWAGSAMTGGLLTVHGDAGDWLAGPLPGERTGMSGGEIVVRGNAGSRAGDRLRRGTVIVEGDAGAQAGSRMVAGTLVVAGRAGSMPGIMARRGTLVLGSAPDLPPGYLETARTDLVFVELLIRALDARSRKAEECLANASRRLVGDTAISGQSELFTTS